MAHGSPRREICNNCNSYGLIPRFSESICPKCGCKTESISREDLKKKLGLYCHQELPGLAFCFHSITPQR